MITVVASDGNLTTTQNVTITLTDVNESPTAISDINGAANSVLETVAAGASAGIRAQGVDPDANTTLVYTLTNDAGGRFVIDALGNVTVAAGAVFNYVTAQSHQITVRATDSGGLFFDQNFTMAVTNSAPTVPVDAQPAANAVAENATNGTATGITASSTDFSGNVTYSLSNSAGGRFAIDAASGIVTVANGSLLNFEAATSHVITVVASDGSLTSSANFTINVTNVNEAPTAVSDTNTAVNSVAENTVAGTAVGITATGTDPDASTVFTYSLTNNAGGRFAINSTSGIVTVAAGAVLDFETAQSHQITVRASDGGLFFDQNFTVNVTNVNEAPTAVSDANTAVNSVAENAVAGATVGITATGTDPDAGTVFFYSLTNNAGGRFAINSTSGVVTMATGAVLDFETAQNHQITVRATDAGGLFTEQAFTVNITDVSDPVTLSGTNGNDVLTGSSPQFWTINGLDGNDQITGNALSDQLNGGAGNDVLNGGAGNDTLLAGDGEDYVYAGADADSVSGGAGNDILLGEAGNDTLNGDAGNDYLYSGAGLNQINGGAGDDIFTSEGSADTMDGGTGHNWFYRSASGSSQATGGDGVDEFVGGAFASNDTFTGNDGDDYALGGFGNDLLSGGNGNDILIGEDGNDTLDGGTGVNYLYADGSGSDLIRVNASIGLQTQLLVSFEGGGTNDSVNITGSTLTSFAGFQALVASLVGGVGTVINGNLLQNTNAGVILTLGLGTGNQTDIWFLGTLAGGITAADLAFV
jgi:Ca2+-binding RTX toxin-like protein